MVLWQFWTHWCVCSKHSSLSKSKICQHRSPPTYMWPTIALMSISIESIPVSVTAASVRANIVMAILGALVCIWHTFIDICSYKRKALWRGWQFVALGLRFEVSGEPTITGSSISIEGVPRIAAAGVRADSVVAILEAFVYVFNTLIDICRK